MSGKFAKSTRINHRTERMQGSKLDTPKNEMRNQLGRNHMFQYVKRVISYDKAIPMNDCFDCEL